MTKILVVEDDATVRMLIVKLLQAEGFEVISGVDGRNGIQLAQSYEPDLIICDIMMPECDGYEVLQQLRQIPETARIPFIFLSAKADRSDLRQGMELGADDYLTKPFKRAELLGAISARLSKQAAITQPYIDEMKRAAETLSQLAYRDPLTELPNRIVLHHRLQEGLRAAERSHQVLAVLCLSLDQFKIINNHLGYANGDLLLQQVAERLRRTFGQEHMVARLGGDEFSLLLLNLPNRDAVIETTQKLLRLMGQSFDFNGHSVYVQISVGIALFPEDSRTADRLLSQADLAMRSAKAQHNSSFQFYSLEMECRVSERQLLESGMKRALEAGEFELHYQPQINLITRRILGAEALLRWNHPELGLVSPDLFIPVAEENGLIIPIGQWVLETACTQAQSWQEYGRPVRLAVNLSARQFRQPDLLEWVAQVLQKTHLSPDLLILELTETCVMDNVEATILTLKGLKQMGVQISIDDFGTGYSSLNYLKRFPIDSLKIDRSFVQDITTDANDAAITKAIIAMSHSLQLKVVAEGVETEEQLQFLRQNACYAIQGFLFSQAVPASAFEQLLIESHLS